MNLNHTSDLVAASYASHGVLQTTSEITFSHLDPLFVGIIATGWPSWAIPFSHRRFTICWIITDSLLLTPIIKRCFKDTLVLNTQDSAITRLRNTDIIAYNGPIQCTFTPPTFGSILLFDWNVRWNVDRHSWISRVIKHSHAACGGVTDFSGCIKIFIHASLCNSFPVELNLVDKYPLADLGSILSHTESGEDLLQPPKLVQLTLPKVTKVTHGCYHLFGLYPTKVANPMFLIPSVFSSSRWVKRSLTRRELLAAYDTPVSLIKLLSAKEHKIVQASSLVPIKCLTAVTTALFLKGEISITGGGWRAI